MDQTSQDNVLEFPSLVSCVLYFRSLGIIMKRDTLSNYIKEGKPFHGYLGRFYDKNLLDNSVSVQLDRLIEEKNKNIVDLKSKLNK
jgi:hypothetical protein